MAVEVAPHVETKQPSRWQQRRARKAFALVRDAFAGSNCLADRLCYAPGDALRASSECHISCDAKASHEISVSICRIDSVSTVSPTSVSSEIRPRRALDTRVRILQYGARGRNLLWRHL